jgi:hypothetical protein
MLTRLKFWIRLALGTETRALEKSFNKHNRFSKVMIWQCDIVADGKAESFECDIYLNLFNPFMYMSTTKWLIEYISRSDFQSWRMNKLSCDESSCLISHWYLIYTAYKAESRMQKHNLFLQNDIIHHHLSIT